MGKSRMVTSANDPVFDEASRKILKTLKEHGVYWWGTQKTVGNNSMSAFCLRVKPDSFTFCESITQGDMNMALVDCVFNVFPNVSNWHYWDAVRPDIDRIRNDAQNILNDAQNILNDALGVIIYG